jgi:hypothetical protein
MSTLRSCLQCVLASYLLEYTLNGHDSLNEQGLRVTHVDVQETHEGDTL